MLSPGDKMGKRIYVDNISNATEQDIKALFLGYGEVISVKIKRSKGFGFVEMGSESDAKKAISGLSGKPFMGKTLLVAEARPEQQRADFHEKKGGFGKGKSFKKAW
jgi:cold-inducible RNA-binding protein